MTAKKRKKITIDLVVIFLSRTIFRGMTTCRVVIHGESWRAAGFSLIFQVSEAFVYHVEDFWKHFGDHWRHSPG